MQKKQRKQILLGLCLLVLSFSFPLIKNFSKAYIAYQNDQLKKALRSVQEEQIFLEEKVPFAWDEAWHFSPYMSKKEMRSFMQLPLAENHLCELYTEGATQIFFLKEKKLVASLCGFPEDLGFSVQLPELSLAKQENRRVFYLSYGSYKKFFVQKDRGVLVYKTKDLCPFKIK